MKDLSILSLTLAELRTVTFLMKPNKELKHFEPDPDTVTFLMKALKKLKHSEPDTDRAPHGHFLNEIDLETLAF